MAAQGPRESPSTTEVKKIGDRWALGLSDEDAAAYAPVLDGFMGSVRKTQELIQEAAKTKSVRKVDWRKPTADENPLNAWYVKTDIMDPVAAKERSLLAGKTIALKDNVALAGVPVMNGSAALEGHIAESDATIVSRILAAGGRITGKATCEDLCLSGGSFTSLPAPVLNPHDRTKQSGGSSSGSGALVAAGEVDLAIACDQGGSIRIPSCWCGVVGLKPTHGLVPYSGIFSMDPSLDHCGPVAKTVADCAAFLQVLAGRDGLDTRQVNTPEKLPAYGDEAAWPNPASLRIGVLKEGFGTEHSEPEVDAAVRAAAEKLKKLGCDIKEVSVPMHLQGGHIWTAVGAEGIYKTQFCGGGQGDNYSADYGADMVAAFHKGMSAHAHRLSHTNKLFLILGAFLQMKYGQQCFAEGREMAMALTAAYDKVLNEEVDVLLLPTLPMRPTPLPEKGASAPLGEAVASALGMIANTAQFNVTGHPALTVPVHPEGSLPIGAMIVGKKFDELSVLSVGAALEGSSESDAVVPMTWCQTASKYLCPRWSS